MANISKINLNGTEYNVHDSNAVLFTQQTLTDAQKQQARGNIGAEAQSNKVTSLSASSTDTQYPSAKAVWNEVGDINEVLDALNGGDSGAFSNLYKMGVVSQTQTWTQASDGGYDYTMSDLVTGYIPQANIDLFESAGATFNATTGYYELNGLTDISYQEMLDIYNKKITRGSDFTNEGILGNARTTLVTTSWGANQSINSSMPFAIGSKAEVVKLSLMTIYPLKFTAYAQFFVNSKYLREVTNEIKVIGGSTPCKLFTGCTSLETVRFNSIERNYNIADSPRLTLASVVYMVENAANTSAITITLHATAYARAIADSDVQAALEAHPTITLASA